MKDFVLRRRDEPRPPETFNLTWEDDAGVKHTQEFKCRPELVPDALWMRIPNMQIDMNTAVLFRIFEIALGDGYDQFKMLIEDPIVQVQGEDLAEIVMAMAEAAAERPTQPSN